MQRLFSSFPDGWPGVGLLLLRAAVGVALAKAGAACFTGGDAPGSWVIGALGILTGAALLSGFLTPFAALVAALLGLNSALSWFPSATPEVLGDGPATLYLVVMAAALLLLGPGAWSLDARLFGRREIVIR